MGDGGTAGLPPVSPVASVAPAATPALRMTPGPGYKVVQCNEEILVVPISVDLNAAGIQCP